MRVLIVAVLLVALAGFALCQRNRDWEGEWKAEYDEIVDDVLSGSNHYKVMDLAEDATQKQVKKAFHHLTRTMHPDKVKGKKEKAEAATVFIQVLRANTVLSNEEYRNVYDELRRKGVPFSKRYGRYMHRYGVNHISVWAVVGTFVVTATAVHYWVLKTRYEKFMRLAKQTPVYQRKVRVLRQRRLDAERSRTGERSREGERREEDDGEEILTAEGSDEPLVEFKGLDAPGLWSLLPVKIARSCWQLGRYFVTLVTLALGMGESKEAQARRELGIENDEEWEAYKEEQMEKYRKWASSAKVKRARRRYRKMQR